MIYRESSDDRQADITELMVLREETRDQKVRNTIDTHLKRIRAGLAGERNVAYFLQMAYGQDPDIFVLHNLRFETPRGVVQLDHVVITKKRQLYLLETKSMRTGIVRDKDGRWYQQYGPEGQYRKPMSDPIEQGMRHVDLVCEMLDEIESNIEEVIAVMIVMPDAKVEVERQQHEDFHIVASDRFKTWLDERPTIRSATTAVRRRRKGLMDDDQIFGVAARLDRAHCPIAYDWRGMVGMREPEAAAATTSKVVRISDHPQHRDRRADAAPKQDEPVSDGLAIYVDQYVGRQTLPIPGGAITIFKHSDGMRSLRAEGPNDVRRNVSLMCRDKGRWIDETKSWLMTFSKCKEVVDELREEDAIEAANDDAATRPAIDIPEGPQLPPATGDSVMTKVNGRSDLMQIITDDGLVRIIKLKKDNYVLRTDANEMNDVRIASVCEHYRVGTYYEQRNNWLIPHNPPQLIERVVRAILAFKHDRVEDRSRRHG